MFARTTDEEPGLRASRVDAGAVDGVHEKLRLRPFPLLPFFIRTTNPQALLGPYQYDDVTHYFRPPCARSCLRSIDLRTAANSPCNQTSAFHGSRLPPSQPDCGVAGQPAISKWGATQDHLARRHRGGVGTEVGHAPYAIAACKVQHGRFGIDPTEVVACEQAAAKGERAPVEIERGVWISLLNANRVSAEPVRLGQVRSLCAEPVRRPVRAPGQRHSASVTALFLWSNGGHRVLEGLPRQVGHLMEAQLVSLIDIG